MKIGFAFFLPPGEAKLTGKTNRILFSVPAKEKILRWDTGESPKSQ